MNLRPRLRRSGSLETDFRVAIAVIFLVCLGFSIGFFCGAYNIRQAVYREAIHNGVAAWTVDKDGYVTIKWLPGTEAR